MSNFFKIRITGAILNENMQVSFETKEIFITTNGLTSPGIWHEVLEIERNEKYKIVSFRFLATYEVTKEFISRTSGLNKEFYLEDEFRKHTNVILAKRDITDNKNEITNHYNLRLCLLAYSYCDELDYVYTDVTCNSYDLLFDLVDDDEEGVLEIIALEVLNQHYIDVTNLSGQYFDTYENEALDDFLLSFGKQMDPYETEALEWADRINKMLLFDYSTKWYDLRNAPRLSKFLEAEELIKLEREIKIASLLN